MFVPDLDDGGVVALLHQVQIDQRLGRVVIGVPTEPDLLERVVTAHHAEGAVG